MCSVEAFARQNCASILLHRQSTALHTAAPSSRGGGVFKCKSCDKAFETFQALGGHRASHKKIRLNGEYSGEVIKRAQGGGLVAPVVVDGSLHECKECRVRFPTGQALGGHMRKHVSSSMAKRKPVEEEEDEDREHVVRKKMEWNFPILDESKMSKRVVLSFDLNLPPPMDEYSFLQLV